MSTAPAGISPSPAAVAAHRPAGTPEPSGSSAQRSGSGPAPAPARTAEPTPESAGPRRLALSPSRAGDFKTCPLLYRYRAIDRLPEPPSMGAARGTLVHAVLERMFGRAAEHRTMSTTAADVAPTWAELCAASPELAGLVVPDELSGWLESAVALVRTYFALEDPRRLAPEACELAVEIEVGAGVPLRGFIDRLDVGAEGQLRVVDYKTGPSPAPDFEAAALYQLKFYALMIYRIRGVVPAQLKLIYLADAMTLTYTPTEHELLTFESGLLALWAAISRAVETRHFPSRRSRMCDWCSHRAICPEFGGTPPPYPAVPPRTAPLDAVPPTGGPGCPVR